MKKYTVLKPFRDTHTKLIQKEGILIEVSEERAAEIVKNLGEGFIKEVSAVEDEFPKHTGGGYYELSNGEKVKGKDAAFEAEKALPE